jgi:hypothetical protein
MSQQFFCVEVFIVLSAVDETNFAKMENHETTFSSDYKISQQTTVDVSHYYDGFLTLNPFCFVKRTFKGNKTLHFLDASLPITFH